MILFWFRNDLRLDDNPGLEAAIRNSLDKNTPLRALFVSTPKQWEKHDRAPIQNDFAERHVHLLSNKLADTNIKLDVLECDDFNQQVDLIADYCLNQKITAVYANEELEINEVNRDRLVKTKLEGLDLNLHLYEADVVAAKGTVRNKQGEMYRVFTPFKREWLSVIINRGFSVASSKQALIEYKESGITEPGFNKNTPQKVSFGADKVDSSQWPLVTELRTELVPDFYQKIARYEEDRDFPAINGTSKLSPYLAIGAVSPKRLVYQLMHNVPNILDNQSVAEFAWLNQIVWRDFYRHLLYHYPNLCKHTNFNQKYDALDWPNNPFLFKAWCEGKTGYPIVDAAMRQLVQTGWMHNRLRMIVASFLTKHLLIDWRIGEAFFAKHLIDYDLANNNGGWQWAAGTGCDAQPYFRIFNPITQSQKFDPEGTFIRKYVPELNRFSNKDIHFPHKVIKSEKLNVYWPAIVDHKTARQNALDFYKSSETSNK